MNGVADELLLFTLITKQHIVIGKALYAFQLYYLEHTHICRPDAHTYPLCSNGFIITGRIVSSSATNR